MEKISEFISNNYLNSIDGVKKYKDDDIYLQTKNLALSPKRICKKMRVQVFIQEEKDIGIKMEMITLLKVKKSLMRLDLNIKII